MSNFTKSILYSTTVLAAGLVAIFAIYNNVTTNKEGGVVAQISPAAGGESAIGIGFEKQAQTEAADVVEDATNTVLDAAETAGSAINSALGTAEEKLADVADSVKELAPAAGEKTDAAGIHNEEPAAQDSPADEAAIEPEAGTEKNSGSSAEQTVEEISKENAPAEATPTEANIEPEAGTENVEGATEERSAETPGVIEEAVTMEDTQ